MSGPRVLVLGQVFGAVPSGVLRHATEVLPRAARVLAERGGALEVLAGAAGLEPGLAAALADSPARVRPSRLRAGPPRRRALAETWRVGGVQRAARAAGGAFDVVHSGHLPLLRAPRGSALCWMLHDLRQIDAGLVGRGRAFLARRLLPAAARRAAAIVVPSRNVAAGLAALAPAARGKTTAIWHGSDHFEPLPRAAAPERLLHLGHLEPRKNVELLLLALAAAPELPPLLLRGGAQPGETERLAQLARALGIAERVEFGGPYTDAELPGLLARAAAVCVPSRVEGFGLACVEALRARAPLAVARAGALPEVAGPFAATFAPTSPEQCAAALRQALAAPASQAERGAKHASSFRWSRSAERLVEVWERAAEAR